MGERPDYSGQVTTFEDNEIGSIALWKDDKDNKKQPEFTGRVSFYNGKKKFKVALWKQREESSDLPKQLSKRGERAGRSGETVQLGFEVDA